VIKWPVKLYVRFFTFFYVFFQNPKKHDFLRFFELLHTFSRTMHATPQSATLGLHPVIRVPNYMAYYSFTVTWGMDCWFFTSARLANAVLAMERWLAGWLSRRNCVKTAKPILKRFDQLVAPSFYFLAPCADTQF